jgi:hypothetical protein
VRLPRAAAAAEQHVLGTITLGGKPARPGRSCA